MSSGSGFLALVILKSYTKVKCVGRCKSGFVLYLGLDMRVRTLHQNQDSSSLESLSSLSETLSQLGQNVLYQLQLSTLSD